MDTGRIRHKFAILSLCGLSFAWLPLCATTRYVVPAGTAGNVPASPYESWESAANDLGSVLSVSADGDEILIKGGTYTPAAGVSVTKRVVLRGVKDGQLVPTFKGSSFSGTDQFLLFDGLSGSAECAVDGLAFDGFGVTAVKISETADVTVMNSSFANCTAAHNGAGIWIAKTASTGCVVSNCTFVSMSATGTGVYGGAVCAQATAVICDSSFQDCSSTTYGGAISASGAGSVVERCSFTGNLNAEYGSAVILLGASSVARRCTFSGITNTAPSNYGTLTLMGKSSMADGCAFYDNTVRGCLIMLYAQSLTFRNCLVASDNVGKTVVFSWYSVPGALIQIDNCTFHCPEDYLFSNSKSYEFGFSFRNCIVVGNIADRTEGKVSYSYSNCRFSNDGGFVYAANGDYRLRPTAPYIDKGEELDWHASGKDLYGRARVADGRVDIGCAEYYPTDPQYSETLRVVASDAEKVDEWANAYVGGAGLASATAAAKGNALVLLKSGTYSVSGPISLSNRDITYRSASAADETKIDKEGTVLDGGSASRIFTIATTDNHPHAVEIEGLTFRNGAQTGTSAAGEGGAIRLAVTNTKLDALACQIRECVFRDCAATSGGALHLQGGTVRDSTFRDCSGNGSFLYAKGHVTLESCLFTGTCAGTYGSIMELWETNSVVSVRNCTFAGLDCTSSTYGWITFKCGGMFENCAITNNANRTKSSSVFFAHTNVRRLALRNCLIAGNANVSTVFSSYTPNAQDYGLYDLENTTVSMPDSQALTSSARTDIGIYNSIVEVGKWPAASASITMTVDHSATNDIDVAGFLSEKRLDYHLRSSSAYVNAGGTRDWHEGATDLDGRPRTSGAVDIGCYERQDGDPDYTETVRVVATEAEKTEIWADAKVGLAAAVGAAADNALILAKAGAYVVSETVDAGDRSVTIRSQRADGSGAADPRDAVLDGRGGCRIFRSMVPVDATRGVASVYRRIVIEGFTFRNGRTVIGDGQADEGLGGGICLVGNVPRAGLPPSEIVNCRFENCEAQYGGGAAVWGGVFRNCVFDGNVATNEIVVVNADKTTYPHSGAGGAICTMQRAMPVSVRDCTPGCLWHELGLIGCAFTNNVAWNIGGAVAGTPSDATYGNRPTAAYVRDCTFADNRLLCLRADVRHAAALGPLTHSFVSNCTFCANSGEYGALRFNADCLLMDATFDGNVGHYGEFACSGADVELERCRFVNPPGVAAFGCFSARNCLFVSKVPYNAIYFYSYSGIVEAAFENCTFVKACPAGTDNPKALFYYGNGSSATAVVNLKLVNCVVDQLVGDAFSSFKRDVSTVTVNNSRFSNEWDSLQTAGLVTDGTLMFGRTGINRASGNYELRNGSACRDMGKVLDWMDANAVDLAGNARIYGDLPDLGCYELQEPRRGLTLIVR